MTDTAEVIEQEPTAEEKAQAEQEAEAGFNAGFAKVSGLKPPTGKNPADNTAAAEEPSDAEKEAEAKAKAKAEGEAKAAADAETAEKAAYEALPKALRDEIAALKAVPAQINKLAGHLGGMKSQLDLLATAKAAAQAKGADAPTDKQVQAALSNPKAWERLTEDFPDWAVPVKAEFAEIRREMAAKAAPTVDLDGLRKEVTANVTQAVDEAEERAFLRMKHPTWRVDVRTPEFKAWLASQPTETVALAESKLADDAIKLLDGYAGHRQKAVEADAARQRKEKRLEQAVTPKGTAVAAQTSLSDEEAFNRGFKRARGH